MKNLVKKYKFRKIILALADMFIIAVSALIANSVAFFFDRDIPYTYLMITMASRVLSCLACLTICGAYRKLWRYFNIKDYLSCVIGVLTGMAIATIMGYISQGQMGWTYTLFHAAISILGICLFRFTFKRTFINLTKSVHNDANLKRTMIIGGGRATKMIIEEIKRSKELDNVSDILYNPVCIIDDNPELVGKKINDVPIVGTRYDIVKFAKEFDIDEIVFAIPSCLEEERKGILDICAETKKPIKILPFIGDLIFGDKPLVKQIRNIKTEELLGRDPIKFDNKDIKDIISGKDCMVTGGGGSIGSELVRQIAKYSPEQIIIVDFYENNA